MITFTAPVISRPRRFVEPSVTALIAARLEPRLRRAFLQSVAALGESASLTQLVEALTGGGTTAAIAALSFKSFEVDLQAGVLKVIRDIYEGAATGAAARLTLRFEISNPRVLDYLQNRAARLVRQVSDDTKASIREILARGYRNQDTPYQMSKEIRKVIGLTERQTVAVDNIRRRLIVDGRKPARVESLTQQYATRTLTGRAKLIATQESKSAAYAGLKESWTQAQETGLLRTGAKKIWIASLAPCPKICAGMGGQEVGINESFETGDGRSVDMPPAHVRCECSAGLSV